MIDRKKIHKKYNGRCAYCGEEITLQSMQIDHIVSKTMHYKYPGIDPNRIDNLNPSCRKCNNFKTVWGIEEFRHELEMQVDRLRRVSQFDRALRYGLVEITNKPVTFYFEQERLVKCDKCGRQLAAVGCMCTNCQTVTQTKKGMVITEKRMKGAI